MALNEALLLGKVWVKALQKPSRLMPVIFPER